MAASFIASIFQNGKRAYRPLARMIQAFHADHRGAAALLFALGLPTIFGILGLSIDYAMISNQKSKAQNITDSSALAVAREMTVISMTPTQINARVGLYANEMALGHGLSSVTATGTLLPDGMAVKVKVTATIASKFGVIEAATGITTFSSEAIARVGQQNKLCLLSLQAPLVNPAIAIDLKSGSRLTAPECVLHTNINQPGAFTIQSGAQTKAALLCSSGGVQNLGGMVDGEILGSCPKLADPLGARLSPNPAYALGCLSTAKYSDRVYSSGTHILLPGVYCGNMTITGTADVRLNPGTYVFQGTLLVNGTARFTGANVGLYFTSVGAKVLPARFYFLQNSFINITAPETGEMAGILIWEGKVGAIIDEALALKPGANYHQINTSQAKNLTGTIYLPGGHLLIDAPVQIAEQSDYTVLVVNRLELSDGPNLVLNSNYSGSRIPVPKGLGVIGARNVRLSDQ